MYKKHPFITGTIILTITGLISRLIGFFYRIYLSRLFGEEGMGIYQLLGPVLALTFSLTAAGLQTAISKYVAAKGSPYRTLITGLFLSLVLSLFSMFILLQFSEQIAEHYLLEKRTASMLRIIAFSIPLSSIHSCINGFFYGVKKTGVPAAAQLVEQVFRVLSVVVADALTRKMGLPLTINIAVLSLVIGELFASTLTIIAIVKVYYSDKKVKLPFKKYLPVSIMTTTNGRIVKQLLGLSIPLSVTRIAINFLQSVESIYIPTMLQLFGYDVKTALSVYGVLTGMALPMLFFPNALTGSISLLLLPVVSEADSSGNRTRVKKTFTTTVFSCLFIGVTASILFFLIGKLLGNILFHNQLAGDFIRVLSFLCPALYLSTTLSSFLHGLGKAGAVFFINVSALLLRLFFVFHLLPKYGIMSYIVGMTISQYLSTVCYIAVISRILRVTKAL